MKGSFKLGRFLGIDVKVHFTFLLLIAFVAVAQWLAGDNAASIAAGLVFLACLFLCVLLHEFGHALAARRYGIATRDITLLPIGGVARLERMPDRPVHELVVALAGPAVNVVIAAGLFLGLALGGQNPWVGLPDFGTGGVGERLLAANVFLVAFNLVPAFPMDGGRVLRALLALRLGVVRATRIAAHLGRGFAVVFGLLGLFYSPMLLLIAVFVWLGATQEAAAVEMRSALDGVLVRDSMLTTVETLSPEETLGEAARGLLAGSQQDFPVLDMEGQPLGILTRERLFASLSEFGEQAPVALAMEKSLRVANPDERLQAVLERLEVGGSDPILVVRHGRLAGLLTAENIVEFHRINAALGSQGPRHVDAWRFKVAPRNPGPRFRRSGRETTQVLAQPLPSPLHD